VEATAQTTLQEPLLTVREAASLLHISPRSLYAWIEDGRVPAIRLGRAIRLDRANLVQVLGGEA
jgi:excisionase family DNA binding protein